MSYLIACKYHDEVFMIGDTAIAHRVEESERFSSFGELHERQGDGRTVEEGLAKIVPLSPSLVLGFVGSVPYSKAIIEYVKDNLDGADIASVLSDAATAIGIPDTCHVEILALQRKGAKSSIVYWKSRSPREATKDMAWVHMGSLVGSMEAAGMEYALKYLASQRIASVDLFHSVIAVMQWFGVHYRLMSVGVGGAFFGARLTSAGFEWQEDISYIIYPPSLAENCFQLSAEEEKAGDSSWMSAGTEFPREAELSYGCEFVTCVVRDNVWAIASTVLGHGKRLMHTSSTKMSRQEWREKWDVELAGYFERLESKYYVFISKLQSNLVVVKTPGGPPDNNLFKFVRNGNDAYNSAFSSSFMEVLTEPRIKCNPNQIPLRFRYTNAYPRELKR